MASFTEAQTLSVFLAAGRASEVLTFDGDFIPIWAFLDTGASGILIGSQTRDLLEIPQAFVGSEPIQFGDIGVGGTELFDVSETVNLKIAPHWG